MGTHYEIVVSRKFEFIARLISFVERFEMDPSS